MTKNKPEKLCLSMGLKFTYKDGNYQVVGERGDNWLAIADPEDSDGLFRLPIFKIPKSGARFFRRVVVKKYFKK